MSQPKCSWLLPSLISVMTMAQVFLGCGSDLVVGPAGGRAGETCAEQTVQEYCAANGCPLQYPEAICETEIADIVSGRAECDSEGIVRFDQIELSPIHVELWYAHDSGRLAFVTEYSPSTLLVAGCMPNEETVVCSGVGISCE